MPDRDTEHGLEAQGLGTDGTTAARPAADPVSTEGGPPQPRQTGDLEGTLKPCCGDYGRSHYANCPKATPEGRLTPRDETICATCSVPKYEHEFTDPELIGYSFACSRFAMPESPEQQLKPHNRIAYASGLGVGPCYLTCPECVKGEFDQCEDCSRVEQAIRRDEAHLRRRVLLSALGLTTRHGSVNLKEQVDGY